MIPGYCTQCHRIRPGVRVKAMVGQVPAGVCRECEERQWQQEFWQTPGGVVHSLPRCRLATRDMKRVMLTRAVFQRATKCRCARWS